MRKTKSRKAKAKAPAKRKRVTIHSRKPKVPPIDSGAKDTTLREQINFCHSHASELMGITESINNSVRNIGGPDNVISFDPMPESKNIYDEITLLKNRMSDLVASLVNINSNLSKLIG